MGREGGPLTVRPASLVAAGTTHACVGVERGGWVWVWFVGTLLGPEGADPGPVHAGVGVVVSCRGRPGSRTARRVGLPLSRWPPAGVGGGETPGGGRLVVENCTVDASIFFDCRPARTGSLRGKWVGVGCGVVVWPSC